MKQAMKYQVSEKLSKETRKKKLEIKKQLFLGTP